MDKVHITFNNKRSKLPHNNIKIGNTYKIKANNNIMYSNLNLEETKEFNIIRLQILKELNQVVLNAQSDQMDNQN